MKPYGRLLTVLMPAVACQAAEGAVAHTAFALEIIQPKAGLDTRNRFYRAHPGLEYSVPLSASVACSPIATR